MKLHKIVNELWKSRKRIRSTQAEGSILDDYVTVTVVFSVTSSDFQKIVPAEIQRKAKP